MELTAEGLRAHLAEPTDTATAHGRKRRAKTDKGDACWKRELLIAGKLPESWIPGGEPLLQQSCLPYELLSATSCNPCRSAAPVPCLSAMLCRKPRNTGTMFASASGSFTSSDPATYRA